MTYTGSQLASLRDLISRPRFQTYLRACGGDQVRAMRLYEWNLTASAAFMVPLQITEVALRNAVADAIVRTHGTDWPRNRGFRITLGQRRSQYKPDQDLDQVVRRLDRSGGYSPGKAVAELSFAFWQEMFTKRHDQAIWNAHLHAVLPNAPIPNVQAMRRWAFDEIGGVRRLRNRIAHHEPIIERDLGVDYDRIRDVASWRNPEAGIWIDRSSQVRDLLAARPR